MLSADLSERYQATQVLARRRALNAWPIYPCWDLTALLAVLLALGGRFTTDTDPAVSASVGVVALAVAFGWLDCERRLVRLSSQRVPGFSRGFPEESATALKRVCVASTVVLVIAALSMYLPLVSHLMWPGSWTVAVAIAVVVAATRLLAIAGPLRQVN